jgi:hypothetical protein
MTAGQDDAAMINHLRWGQCWRDLGRESSPFAQRATAGGTPICHRLFGEYRVALVANTFHTFKIT